MKDLYTPIKEWETTTLNDAVLDWTISLREAIWVTKWAIESAKIQRIFFHNIQKIFPVLETIKRVPSKEEKERFSEVDWYLKNTASMKLNKERLPPLQESNWKLYLDTWKGNEIFEVIEQRWKGNIVLNPVTKLYSIYICHYWNYFERMLNWADKIEKTDIDWYYKISEWNSIWYYYIWEKVWFKNLWIYENMLQEIQQHWGAVFFQWIYSEGHKPQTIIHNWSKVENLYSNWNISKLTSQNWRHLLKIDDRTNNLYALYNIEQAKFHFRNASSIDLTYTDSEWTIENKIEYTFLKPREFLQFLWKKKEKHEINL